MSLFVCLDLFWVPYSKRDSAVQARLFWVNTHQFSHSKVTHCCKIRLLLHFQELSGETFPPWFYLASTFHDCFPKGKHAWFMLKPCLGNRPRLNCPGKSALRAAHLAFSEDNCWFERFGKLGKYGKQNTVEAERPLEAFTWKNSSEIRLSNAHEACFRPELLSKWSPLGAFVPFLD